MSRSARGYSILELLLVCGLFSGFMLSVQMILSVGAATWDRDGASGDTLIELQKAKGALNRELRETRFCYVRTARSSRPTLRTEHGDVLWFLSAEDPETRQVTRDIDGSPFWRRNVLYYLTRASDHDETFGARCRGQRCPHQVLVRRVMRNSPYPGSPDVPAEDPMPEELMIRQDSIFADGVAAPLGPGLSGIAGTAESTEVVAKGLLLFWTELEPTDPVEGAEEEGDDLPPEDPYDPTEPFYREEIQITLRGFNLDKAGQKVELGRESLENSPFTQTMKFSVFSEN